MKHTISTRVIALTLDGKEPRILLPIKRIRKRRIRKIEKRALPGGRKKVRDKNWQHTIAREFEEETKCPNIDPKRFRYVGTITLRYTRLGKVKKQRVYSIILSKKERKLCKDTDEMRDCRSFRFGHIPWKSMSRHYRVWLLFMAKAVAYKEFEKKIFISTTAE